MPGISVWFALGFRTVAVRVVIRVSFMPLAFCGPVILSLILVTMARKQGKHEIEGMCLSWPSILRSGTS